MEYIKKNIPTRFQILVRDFISVVEIEEFFRETPSCFLLYEFLEKKYGKNFTNIFAKKPESLGASLRRNNLLPKSQILHLADKKRREKQEEFIQREIGYKNIQEFLDEYNSPQMYLDYIRRDFWNSEERKNIKETFFRLFPTIQVFTKFLKRVGITYDCKKYNKLKPWEKMVFKYPKETSSEEIKRICQQIGREGQKLTSQIRIKNGSYKNQPFRKEWSPLCLEFYTSRGFSEEAAREKMYEITFSGARSCLKITQKPKTEKIIRKWLEENSIFFTEQVRVKAKKRLSYLFDFCIPGKKIMLECNGTYWHCDPRFFKSSDIVKFPGGSRSVEEVWAKDFMKRKIAENLGFQVYSIWEHDMNNNSEKVEEELCRILDIEKNVSNMLKLNQLNTKPRKSRSTILQ